ncbi:MAG: hypothetical protein ACYDBX_01325 [Patescibacteria group bacterium]
MNNLEDIELPKPKDVVKKEWSRAFIIVFSILILITGTVITYVTAILSVIPNEATIAVIIITTIILILYLSTKNGKLENPQYNTLQEGHQKEKRPLFVTLVSIFILTTGIIITYFSTFILMFIANGISVAVIIIASVILGSYLLLGFGIFKMRRWALYLYYIFLLFGIYLSFIGARNAFNPLILIFFFIGCYFLTIKNRFHSKNWKTKNKDYLYNNVTP